MRPKAIAGVLLASALTAQSGCSSDPSGPNSLGDDVRIPLTAAITAAQRGGYVGVPSAAFANGMTELVIAQLAAAGQLDRSRDESGIPTDPISQDRYDAAAVLLQYDVITPQGFRLIGETLDLLAWSGLDRNRGRVEALMNVSAGVRTGSLVPMSFDDSGAGSRYFVASEGLVFENSPSISFDLATLDAGPADSPCRGAVPDSVTCQVGSFAGRATGSFHFFAKGITPGQPQSNFHYRDTSFDLPVTVMRLVDTLRFAGAVAQ